MVGNAGYPGYDEPGVRDLDDPADLLCDLNPGLDRRGGREAASASTQNPRVEIIKYSFQKYIFSSFKGTVRPDWICMRVVSLESPLKAHQPL